MYKNCELCGGKLIQTKIKKFNRFLFKCEYCNYSELKETFKDVQIRIGNYDNHFGILKPTILR